MEVNPQLAAFAFGLGIVSLLWAFRRTLRRLARLKLDPDEQSYSLRRSSATRAIDEISAREWLLTYQRSERFSKTQYVLSPRQSALLSRLSAWQESRSQQQEARR